MSADGDSAAAVPVPRDTAGPWDSRARVELGVSWIRLDSARGYMPLLYVSLNYRLSFVPLLGAADDPRLGAGVEAGVFYLFPYLRLGPEFRWRRFVGECHAGAVEAFLVGTDTPGGVPAWFAGASAGYTLPAPDVTTLEFLIGLDYVKLLNLDRPGTWMPHLTVAMQL